eukprot:GHVU01223641.1.p1 GENE.GHVU01223641.1~~GHVU01223641.1.p1  ORF type:complete len:388 (+),score=52.36 GHVU01223641.1:83-1165(+)
MGELADRWKLDWQLGLGTRAMELNSRISLGFSALLQLYVLVTTVWLAAAAENIHYKVDHLPSSHRLWRVLAVSGTVFVCDVSLGVAGFIFHTPYGCSVIRVLQFIQAILRAGWGIYNISFFLQEDFYDDCVVYGVFVLGLVQTAVCSDITAGFLRKFFVIIWIIVNCVYPVILGGLGRPNASRAFPNWARLNLCMTAVFCIVFWAYLRVEQKFKNAKFSVFVLPHLQGLHDIVHAVVDEPLRQEESFSGRRKSHRPPPSCDVPMRRPRCKSKCCQSSCTKAKSGRRAGNAAAESEDSTLTDDDKHLLKITADAAKQSPKEGPTADDEITEMVRWELQREPAAASGEIAEVVRQKLQLQIP